MTDIFVTEFTEFSENLKEKLHWLSTLNSKICVHNTVMIQFKVLITLSMLPY